MPLRTTLKHFLESWLGRLTGRHALLLSPAAGSDVAIDLAAPYRVEGKRLSMSLHERAAGALRVRVLAYEGGFPTGAVYSGSFVYERHASLSLVFEGDGGIRVALDGVSAADEADERPRARLGRRFCVELTLAIPGQAPRARLTGHYFAVDGGDADAAYFQGDNYSDYEAEGAAQASQVVELLRAHHARGPLLEVGSATGSLLAALDALRLPSLSPCIGIDSSAYAVAETARRLGPDRAYVSNVDDGPLPGEVLERGPFGVLVLWSVLEHFRAPFEALRRLTHAAAPGSLLFINTTNADGISRRIFGDDWEGPFDRTHLGVALVGAEALRRELPLLGYRILRLETHTVWDKNADPTRATLRDWWDGDARFRRLLAERDLGDLITCVALKDAT